MTKSSRQPSTILGSDLNLSVALVEPRIPQNAGNITRLCACTGSDLFFVGNLGFQMNDRHLSRSAMDYKEAASVTHVHDFKDVLAQKPDWTPVYASTKAKYSYTDFEYPDKTLLVFGSETQGLPEWLIEENPETSVRIPMVEGVRSLNLSSSVAIILYEAIRQRMLAVKETGG